MFKGTLEHLRRDLVRLFFDNLKTEKVPCVSKGVLTVQNPQKLNTGEQGPLLQEMLQTYGYASYRDLGASAFYSSVHFPDCVSGAWNCIILTDGEACRHCHCRKNNACLPVKIRARSLGRPTEGFSRGHPRVCCDPRASHAPVAALSVRLQTAQERMILGPSVSRSHVSGKALAGSSIKYADAKKNWLLRG